MNTPSRMNSESRELLSVRWDRTVKEKNSFMEVVLERRATPHFAPTPVPPEVLDTILAAAGQAPSGYNFQPWRFLVLRTPERREALKRAAFDQAKISEAPVVVVAFAQRGAWRDQAGSVIAEAAERGALAPDNLPEKQKQALDFISAQNETVWLTRQVMIAFTFMMLAAEVIGWNTAPMEGFDPAAVRRELGLPDNAEVIALLAIGRATGRERPFPGRLPMSQIAFADHIDRPWQRSSEASGSGSSRTL